MYADSSSQNATKSLYTTSKTSQKFKRFAILGKFATQILSVEFALTGNLEQDFFD